MSPRNPCRGEHRSPAASTRPNVRSELLATKPWAEAARDNGPGLVHRSTWGTATGTSILVTHYQIPSIAHFPIPDSHL